jgi:hypothetical protein
MFEDCHLEFDCSLMMQTPELEVNQCLNRTRCREIKRRAFYRDLPYSIVEFHLQAYFVRLINLLNTGLKREEAKRSTLINWAILATQSALERIEYYCDAPTLYVPPFDSLEIEGKFKAINSIRELEIFLEEFIENKEYRNFPALETTKELVKWANQYFKQIVVTLNRCLELEQSI